MNDKKNGDTNIRSLTFDHRWSHGVVNSKRYSNMSPLESPVNGLHNATICFFVVMRVLGSFDELFLTIPQRKIIKSFETQLSAYGAL